jgi:hypothetical protein
MGRPDFRSAFYAARRVMARGAGEVETSFSTAAPDLPDKQTMHRGASNGANTAVSRAKTD